jgi:type II secretory pathway pseudopilin PulG
MNRARRLVAMTLLEIILVLAIIIAIGAVVGPRLQKSFARQRVKHSGELVRASFNLARVDAMKSGKIHVFRCELDSSKYSVSAWDSSDDGSRRNAVVADDPTTSAAAVAPIETTSGDSSTETRSLPAGVRFIVSESLASKRMAATEKEIFGEAIDAGSSEAVPILFYPDGSSSHSQVIIADEKNNSVVVSLRGITGLSTVGDVKPLDVLTAN